MAGKAKRKDLTKILEEAFHSDDVRGMTIARGFAARALNCDEGEIPSELDTPAKLSAWVNSLITCAGGIDHLRENYDRLSPKPKRVEVSGPGGSPVRVAIGTAAADANEQAKRYFDEMRGGAQAPAEVEIDVEALLS